MITRYHKKYSPPGLDFFVMSDIISKVMKYDSIIRNANGKSVYYQMMAVLKALRLVELLVTKNEFQ